MTISVALPVYNGANYLREALESLVGQGPALAEIVIADNCSSDATADIVREFAVKDPRVRHERSEVFLNQADNISRAVQLCRQEWVQLLCHDDLLRPGAIAALAGVIDGLKGKACALIGHQPAHLFTDEHTYRHRNGVGMVETRAALMAAAVAGGVTSLVCPPDTDPVLDEPGQIEMLRHRAEKLHQSRVLPLGALTRGLKGEVLTEMGQLTAAGCVGFSQAEVTLANTQVMQRA
ncbi:MAG: Dihydroorotase, partial [Verrucomicrobiota bacterium]